MYLASVSTYCLLVPTVDAIHMQKATEIVWEYVQTALTDDYN